MEHHQKWSPVNAATSEHATSSNMHQTRLKKLFLLSLCRVCPTLVTFVTLSRWSTCRCSIMLYMQIHSASVVSSGSACSHSRTGASLPKTPVVNFFARSLSGKLVSSCPQPLPIEPPAQEEPPHNRSPWI